MPHGRARSTSGEGSLFRRPARSPKSGSTRNCVFENWTSPGRPSSTAWTPPPRTFIRHGPAASMSSALTGGSPSTAVWANWTSAPRTWRPRFVRSWAGERRMRVRIKSLWLTLAAAGMLAGQASPSAEAILRRAIERHQSGDMEGAVSAYREYLQQNGDSVVARSNLGAALSRLGRYEEAIAEYTQAIKKEPGNLPVRVNLALAYYKTAQIATAAEHLAQVVAKQPSNRQAVLLLADCNLQLGEDKKVIELLAPLEKEAPDDKS